MSYDLGFWKQEGIPSVTDAARVDAALVDGDVGGVPSSDDPLGAFYGEILERYPDLTLENVDESPWSTPVWRTGEGVICSFAHSRHAEVSGFLLDLASRHGLVCFDPQSQRAHFTVGDGTAVLETADGSVITGPQEEHIVRAVNGLSTEDWYVVLETTPGRYVQAGLGLDAGVPEGVFAVEVRDGSDGSHVRALVDDVSAVLAAFQGFAAGERGWRTGLAFTPVWY
jgi:hypothetical protein